MVRQFLEAGNLLRVLDQSAQLRYLGRMLFGQPGLIRLAAFAGAEARPFGVRAAQDGRQYTPVVLTE
jgi:hypothetical protein